MNYRECIKILKEINKNGFYKFNIVNKEEFIFNLIRSIDNYVAITPLNTLETNHSFLMENKIVRFNKNNILYIKIFNFTLEDINIWNHFFYKSNNKTSFILDLRNCSGGNIKSALFLCHKMLPPMKLKIQFRNTYRKLMIGSKQNKYKIYCLVGENTISSGELLAGLIKESKWGCIIGECNTFGKNTIQKTIEIGSHKLSFTIGKFLFNKLEDIEHIGIEPDIIKKRFIDDSFEKLSLNKNIALNDRGSNIFAFQNILNYISEEYVLINGICNVNTLEITSLLLDKKISEKIVTEDLQQIYHKYMNHCIRFDNDNHITFVMKELINNEN